MGQIGSTRKTIMLTARKLAGRKIIVRYEIWQWFVSTSWDDRC